ncbi:MAG: hypothetical protein Q9217_001478 [Psora testacea]
MSDPRPVPVESTQDNFAESRRNDVIVAVTIVTVLGVAGVVLRCISRRISSTKLSYDDYLIMIALVCLICLNVLSQIAVMWGLGQHLPATGQHITSFQKVSLDSKPILLLGSMLMRNKASLANFSLYFTTSFFTKASLLTLYFRLFSPNKYFRYAVYIATIVVICQFMSSFFAVIFQCVPMAGFWNPDLKGVKCINLFLLSLVSGVLNLLTDVMILCLPLPMVWSLNSNKAQKVMLTGIFMLGTFVCITSIIRIIKIAKLRSRSTWSLIDPIIWTSIEASVGVLCACLPTMRPFYQHYVRLPSWVSKSSRTKGTAASGSERRADNYFARLDEEANTGGYTLRNKTCYGDRPVSKRGFLESEEEYALDDQPTRQRPSLVRISLE